MTLTPVFDCWCVDGVSDKCITFDIGAKSHSCEQIFSPDPPASATIKYSILSGTFCLLLLILCIIITISGCMKAIKEEDKSASDPLKLVDMGGKETHNPLDSRMTEIIKIQQEVHA
jgi:hypothetical protein